MLEVVLKSASGEDTEVAKQPPLNGVGGNPYIFVQFYDDDGRSLHRKPILLGRCVQGLQSTSVLFALATHGEADITAEGCRCGLCSQAPRRSRARRRSRVDPPS